ncbi:FXYD domain-containing ion transport regulator 3 isoform X1 [Pelobates fuscus]|uniref:FXYD domain-containing ion transport regulator 3 isoform X1 n=1 Tax=Pelobates fuscus TaxID=191477 RepID=UPI002FE45A05
MGSSEQESLILLVSALSCFILTATTGSTLQNLKMLDLSAALLLVLAALPCLQANDIADSDKQFYYDYESLKIAGLIMAGVLCALGIIILMSGKCKCKFNQKNDRRNRAQEPQIITPGTASHC